jgi:Zn-dependent protease
MTPTRQGSFRLFRFAGVEVFLHWSWFLVAAYLISNRVANYSSPVWAGLEYLSLFVIVLMHEFGHALACRQVGGEANQIVLWPLGGVAYVSPPIRPGATLWSIAAGPLVNVILAPLFIGLVVLGRSMGWQNSLPDAQQFITTVCYINLGLLVFNLLPIYPLDGGQIVRSLLWFVAGRARSLLITTFIGFAGVAALAALAFGMQSIWLGIISAFILMNCWRGWVEARVLLKVARAPRHEGFACPNCKAAPPQMPLWLCGNCRVPFDTFATQGVCPNCGAQALTTQCVDCRATHPLGEWILSRPVPPPIPQSW